MKGSRKAIYLDIDAPFEFVLAHLDFFKEHLEWLEKHMKSAPKVRGIEVERSTNGYAHIIVHLDREVTDIDENHYALAMGSSFALYVFAKMREKAIGTTDKVLFSNGRKTRPRKVAIWKNGNTE